MHLKNNLIIDTPQSSLLKINANFLIISELQKQVESHIQH